MDKNIILKLECNGKSVDIGKDILKLIAIEGITSSDYDINLGDNIRSDGAYVNRTSIKPRPIVIKAEYTDMSNLEEVRQKLIGFFNPKMQGTLFVNYLGVERYIHYYVEKFKDKRSTIHEPLEMVIDLICPSPHFLDVVVSEEISTWIGGLRFKFTLPFKLKQKGEPRKNIYNSGHVETPIKAIFKGPAVNPCIKNLTTGEFIKINRTLTSDDTLYIDTSYRNKTVEIERNGIRKNAFNYIDLDSTFFNLVVGDNLIEHTTDNNLDPQSVEIRYSNRYLGV